MSEDRSLDAVREEKLRELKSRVEEDTNSAAGEASAEPIHFDSQQALTEAASRYDVFLVDFYADWCGPCKMIEPVVAEIAAETDAAVGKVDIDANQRLAAQYGVQSVPNLVIFKDGEAVDRVVGVKEKPALLKRLRQHGDI